MAFCRNCGNKLIDNSKFCQNCGCPTSVDSPNDSVRKQEYVGKVFKCPNCGEVLESFLTRCPSCGMELRGSKAANSVRELALKLEAIEAHREYEKPQSIFKKVYSASALSKTDEQKISLIRSFSIPNTKEDILEFMILATANVDMSSYADGESDIRTASSRAVSNAWLAKCEQAYEKAKVSIPLSDQCYIRIEELYQKTKKDLKKNKGANLKKSFKLLGIIYGVLIALILVLVVSDKITAPAKNKAEEERLTAIVTEIEENMEAGKYKLALLNAESMNYEGKDTEAERKWNIKKEYLIEEILEEAEKNGVHLEYTPPSDDENNEGTDTSSGGFIEGFKEGMQPGMDEAKQNIEEAKRILNGEDNTEE